MTSPRTSRALIVGISEYTHVDPLEFSVSDAHELAQILARPEYDYNVTTILDDQATRSQLLTALQDLFFCEANNLLFYFSGHGASPQYGAYLCSVDATPNDPGIDLALLSRFAASAARPGRTTTILLDCCHAGAMTFSTPNSPPALLKSPHVADSFSSLPEGHVLFAACRPNEFAHESASLGHGFFSYHLLLGLHGDAANEGGQVTAASLHDYVSRSLEGSAIAQTMVYRGDIAGVFVLGQGFSPIRRPASDSVQLAQVIRQARVHLDSFQQQTGHDYAQREYWAQAGYKAACQRFWPIVNWFNNRERDYPELRNHQSFRASVEDVHAWQARLSDIENVSHTPWGTIERRLGYGTFGTVYLLRARETEPSERIAFKIYHGQDIRLQDKATRFRRGFAAMKMLDHPRILKVGELCECPLGFTMDYIDGPNFRQFTGYLEVSEQLQLILTVAETIAHAHSRGVVHRDVKPENILLSEADGVWLPWLADFDLAWFSTASVVTRDAIGSAFYSAPEQIHKPRSNAARSPKVDQYAFGQLLFFGLTGTDPLQQTNDNLEELRSRFATMELGGRRERSITTLREGNSMETGRTIWECTRDLRRAPPDYCAS